MSKGFGRDEMNALLGGSNKTEEMAAFRPSTAPSRRAAPASGPQGPTDWSQLSAAEAAAMLQKNNQSATKEASTGRYRTQRVMEHHALAQELAQEQETLLQQQASKTAGSARSSQLQEQSDEEDFIVSKQLSAKRTRAAPQILHQKPTAKDDKPSSPASPPESPPQRPRRRRVDSSSSSSDDEEQDRRQRRQHLLERQKNEPQVIQLSVQNPAPKQVSHSDEPLTAPSLKPKVPIKPSQSSSSDSGSGSDGSSSDDSSSDSSSEEEAIAKPIFVPKHKRRLVQSDDQKYEEDMAKTERQQELAQKRKLESRAMVARTVAAVSNSSVNEDEWNEEAGGATNQPPDDKDENTEADREAWEMRELVRLFETMDKLKQEEQERLEVERRRQMSHEEVLQQDIATGRYQAPGSGRNQEGNYNQRFYHRGAYYMESEEWDKDDVRHKAAEYAKAATGEDKIDRSVLPKVMQVKGFGMARQNTRYKGLAQEDTTDKRSDFLPLVHDKKRNK